MSISVVLLPQYGGEDCGAHRENVSDAVHDHGIEDAAALFIAIQIEDPLSNIEHYLHGRV